MPDGPFVLSSIVELPRTFGLVIPLGFSQVSAGEQLASFETRL